MNLYKSYDPRVPARARARRVFWISTIIERDFRGYQTGVLGARFE